MTERADYGLDAPGVQRNLVVLGAAMAVLAAAGVALGGGWFGWPLAPFLMFVSLAGTAAVMFWSSRVGKFAVRDKLLASVKWTGAERVLDIGCGRGLALIGAAKRLTTGEGIGIDLWSQTDLSANSPDAARTNARIEGVADKVQFVTGDARRLPFADGSFDVVISMTALHNIVDAADRARAIREAVRVLAPGGRFAAFDIQIVGEYAKVLAEAGMQEIDVSGPILLWLMPGGRITARKPGAT